MPAIVMNDHRIVAADYFQNELSKIPTYVFIGGTSQWNDENLPPNIDDSTKDKIFAYDEMIGVKRIQVADIISVLPRINWQTGTVYDEYRADANIIDNKNPETDEFYKFYVITDEFNVYKCISNNYRTESTIKPSGTSINTFETPDGYVWKYMYTVKSPDAFTYMTPNWIPCYTLYNNDGSSQWLVQQAATPGTVDNIIVTDGGANYTSATPPGVTVDGDGTGASAVAEVDDESGTVTKIIVTDPGQNYTYATVTINGSTGIGATAQAIISPIKGHGHDARSELGAVYKMIRVVFEGDEGGSLPIGIEYRKAGILSKPLSKTSGIILSVIDTSLYKVGEVVTGQSTGATGTIRVVDPIRGYLYLESVTGEFSQSEFVSSQTYNQTEIREIFITNNLPIVASVAPVDDVLTLSGELLYFSTREKISRGLNQQEEIRFVIAF